MKRVTTLLLCIALMFLMASMAQAQTVLIDPAGNGGFETGPDFLSNGWTVVNHATNTWQVGAASTPFAGVRAAYISNDGGTTNAYTNSLSQTSHFYTDVAIPAGQTKITLSFQWKGYGESGWDRLLVYTAPTTVTPVVGVPASSSTALTGATLVFTQATFPQSTYALQTITLPGSLAGTTARLIFTWQNDNSGGTNPPIGIDNISLVSALPVPLVGGTTYPINGVQAPPASFATMTSAAAYLGSDGVTGSGQVVLELTTGYVSGGEPGPVSVNAIPGVSPTLGVTFRPALGYTALTTIAGTSSFPYTFKLNACSYVTLDGRAGGAGTGRDWNIKCTGSTYGQVAVRLDNTSGSMTGIVIRNLIMEAEASSVTGAIVQITGSSTNTFSNIDINGNLIRSNSLAATFTGYGIWLGSPSNTGNTAILVRNNEITQFYARGIYLSGGYPGVEIYGNQIHHTAAFAQPSTTEFAGIYFSTTASPGTKIYNNYLYDFQLSNGSTAYNGIYLFSANTTGARVSVYNNRVVMGATLANAYPIYGIRENTGTTALIDFYHNSVLINGTLATGAINSAAFMKSLSNNLNLKNNAFYNTRTNSAGTGTHWAISVNNTSFTSIGNNDYFADGTGGVLGTTTGAVGGNQTTLSGWKAVVTADLGSVSQNPNYLGDLHINTATPTQLESGGAVGTGVTTDFEGDPRLSPPDIGADEFVGIPLDLTPPTIAYTPLLNTDATTSRTLVVTVTDAGSGVPTTAPGWPNLYWKKATDLTYTAVTPSSVVGSTYTYNFGTGVVTGDVVSYYVVAQDGATAPNVSAYPSAGAGGFTINPPAASTPPTTPSSYTISASALAGDYTVGILLFNRASGRNISFERVVTRVMKQVPELMAAPQAQAEALSTGKALPTASPATTSPEAGYILTGRMVMREVEQVSWVPMENGTPYTGPLYVKRSENPNLTPDAKLGIYATLTAAVADLNLRGVSGPTRFLLNDSSYPTETFPIIVNVASVNMPTVTNTITFKPNTGVVATVSGAAASGQIFKILNSYVTIDGSNAPSGTTRDLTLQNTSTTGPSVVVIGSTGTTPIVSTTLKNTICINGANTSSAVLVSDGAAPGAAGYFNNITLQNNSVQLAYIGVYCNAVIATGNGSGLTLTGNALNTSGANSVRLAGLYVGGVDGATVSNNSVGNMANTLDGSNITGIWFATGTVNSTMSLNTIGPISGTAGPPRGIVVTSSTNANVTVAGNTVAGITTSYSSAPYGIYVFSTTTGVTLEKNFVSGVSNTNTGGYGARGIHVNTGLVSSNITLKNNFVWGITATSDASSTYWLIGIGIEGATAGVNLYHNSVNLSGNFAGYSSATVSAALAIITSTAAALDIRDNIFVNTYDNTGSSTDKSYAVNSAAANAAFTDINYNDYYVSGVPGVLGYLGGDQTTLAAWQTATAKDANSISGDPKFISATNLHIDPSFNVVSNNGFYLASVPTDIDNETRANPPDIGADEYTYVPPSVIDPTGVSATAISHQQIDVAFTPNASSNPVVVVWNLTGTFTVPSGVPSIGGSLAGGTVLSIGITSPVPHTSLTPVTHYFYKAFSYDGAVVAYSPGIAADATTLFAPITSYPYNQGFEEVAFPPTGWVRQDVNGGSTWQRSTSSQRTGVACAYYPYSSSFAGDDWLFTPPLAMTAGSEYKIAYWYKVYSATFPENMKVMVGTAPNAASMTAVVADHPGITSTTYISGLATFTPTATGTYYFGFQCYSLADQWNLYLDDVQISVVQPVDYALSALVQVNGIPTPFRPAGSVESRMDKSNGGQLAFVRDRSGKGAHSAMPGVNKSVVLPREASPAQTKNTMFVNGNPFNGGASIDATNPITMRATVGNIGLTAPSYNLDFTIAGVPQTTIPRPGIASGTTEDVDIIATVTDPGTWTTVATATAAGDGDPTNNTATYLRTLVYPTDNIRAHYDNGTNTPSTFIGFGTNNLPLTGGVRFTAPANMRITNVDAFYRNENSAADVTVKVWAAGNTNNAPGALLYSRTFNTANYIAPGTTGDYITLPLETTAPAFGAGSDFWISITYDAAIQYPLGAHSTGITTGRSFVSADGGASWDPLVISPTEYAWLLRAVGVTSTAFAPVIAYTPLPGTGQLTGPTLNATITHPDGINTTTGTSPRIYYKKSTNANALNDNTSTTDGWKYVEATGVGPFSFTINYSLLFGGTGVTIGDVIQYFVVAQNLALPPRVGIRTGNFAAEPTSVALTSAAFPVTSTYSYSILPQITSFPYTETFEGATAGWGTEIYSGTVNDWVLGTPAKTQIASAHSGTMAWVTKTTGNYSDNQDAYVVSPLLNFSALSIDPTLEFWHNFYTEAGWDGAVVEYSTDGGSTWAKVDANLGTGTNFTTANSFNWYNSSSTLGPMPPPKFSDVSTVYGGASAGWIKSITLLSGTAGNSTVRVRWRFASDGSGNFEGWAIDDVSIIPDGTPPAIVYTALGNIGNTTNRVFSSVAITDGSGVNLNAGTRPRVYYKRSTDANALNDNTPATDGWKYAEAAGTGGSPFSFTIDYSLLNGGTGVTFGTSVEYFVVAQDLAVPPNVAINTGTFAAAPASVALTSAAFPLTGTINGYTVVPSMGGSYTVGTGGTYGTLKDAFDAINGAILTSNITLTVVASTAETAPAVLNQMSYDGGPYTLYIRPPSGTAKLLTPVTISSAAAYTIELNGADNVVIDGRPGGVGTAQDLTIENTSLTGVALNFVNGATNNTVRYSILKGVNTSTTTGVVVLSTATGAGNSNNTIANCAITAGATWPAVGVYASSSASPANNTNNLIQNCDISDFTAYGVYLLNGVTTTTLEGTNIHQSAPSTALSVYGVYIGNAPGTTIRKNRIYGLSSTSTSSTIEGVEYFGASGVVMTGSIYNNFIALDAAATTDGATIRGIDYYGWAANSVDIDFNSIYIGGTAVTGGTTSALAKRDAATTFNMRDNIAFNARANGTGTGKHYAVYVNNTVATTMVLNNNDYLANGTGGFLGYWSTTDHATLADWQLASGQDAASISQDPLYIGASTVNLHVQVTSPVSNAGVAIAGITDDIDGDVRQTPPDMGADEFTSTATRSIPILLNWNMVSLPVSSPTPDDSVQHLFTNSINRYAFIYAGSYQQRFTMTNAPGYWIKSSAAYTQDVTGVPRDTLTVPVTDRWNMIGSISTAVDTSVAHVTPSVPGLRVSSFFKYAGGYQIVTTIQPGLGYWVKTSSAGSFFMHATGPAAKVSAGGSGRGAEELYSVTIKDANGGSQTLYFGADAKKEIPVDMYVMPPLPPVGSFDARFETADGGTMAQTHPEEVSDVIDLPIAIQSSAYPLTVSWKINGTSGSYELGDGTGVMRPVRGEGSMQITNSAVNHLTLRVISGSELPKEFALSQNYPNPFNPTTRIKYDLPVDSRVTVEIYNVLGQKVCTLLNEDSPAGRYVAQWNGTGNGNQQLGSGVYFLQLSAKGVNGKAFNEIRKLMLLK